MTVLGGVSEIVREVNQELIKTVDIGPVMVM